MKPTNILQIFLLLLFAYTTNAQQGINYKAIINDSNGNALADTTVTIQFTILENETTNVYQETHSQTTDDNGILIVNIGEGTPISGDYNAIDWGSNPHSLKTEIDTGEGLTDMGTTEFKTVPYALFAESSGAWTINGANIYRLSGNIGIGTTSPSVALHLNMGGDALFGGGLNDNERILIWDWSRGAFRAGSAQADSWNQDSLGYYSTAFGMGTVANADMSFAQGFRTHACTYAGFSIGQYNVGTAGSVNNWEDYDPLFEVGNGTSYTARNNAFTIRKNGRIGINDATPDYLLDIENNDLSRRSIYINHTTTRDGNIEDYGIGVYCSNTASASAPGYAGYFSMDNINDNAYGLYARGRCYATLSRSAFGVRAYALISDGIGSAFGVYSRVYGTSTGPKYAGYFDGDVYTTGSYLPSDRKLKTAMQSATESAIDRLMQLQVNTFQYNIESYPSMNLPAGMQTGLTAQNVELHYPELVKEAVQPAPTEQEAEEMGAQAPTEDISFKVIDYTRMVPHLIKALQEQQAEIEDLKQRIAQLER